MIDDAEVGERLGQQVECGLIEDPVFRHHRHEVRVRLCHRFGAEALGLRGKGDRFLTMGLHVGDRLEPALEEFLHEVGVVLDEIGAREDQVIVEVLHDFVTKIQHDRPLMVLFQIVPDVDRTHETVDGAGLESGQLAFRISQRHNRDRRYRPAFRHGDLLREPFGYGTVRGDADALSFDVPNALDRRVRPDDETHVVGCAR
jgi:hypothetical protein